MIVLPAKLEIDTKDAEKDLKEIKGTLDKMLEVERYEKFAGWLGDLRDVFDLTATSLLGFTEAEAQAASEAANLAEKGITLGAAFGPVGAVIGGIAGGALGYYHREAKLAAEQTAKLAEEAKKTAARMDELTRENEALAESLSTVGDDVPSLIGDMASLERQIQEVNKELGKGGTEFELWLQRFNMLAAAQNKDAMAAGDLIKEQLLGSLSALNAAEAKPKGVKDLKADLKDLTDPSNNRSIPGLKKQISDLYIKIDDFEKTEGLSKSGNYTKEWAQQTVELTGQLTRALAKQAEIKDKLKETADAAKKIKTEIEDPGDSVIGQLGRDAVDARLRLEALGKELDDLPLPLFGGTEGAKELDAAAANYKAYIGIISSSLGEFTGQLEDNIAAGEAALSGMGLAAERAVAQILKALGREWATKAISELAAGFAALSTPGFSFLAAGHFRSAALYGAAAAAAGIGGAVAAGDAGRRGNAQAEEDGGASSGGGFGAGVSAVDGGPTEMAPVIVYLGGGPGSTTINTGTGEESEARAGRIVERLLGAARRGGPTLRGRRN